MTKRHSSAVRVEDILRWAILKDLEKDGLGEADVLKTQRGRQHLQEVIGHVVSRTGQIGLPASLRELDLTLEMLPEDIRRFNQGVQDNT